MSKDLSILIPARNEMFIAKTIEDILANIEADTEVLAILDGAWANPPIAHNPRVNVIYVPEAVGQRAATNLGAKLSRAKYLMKIDAHCSFDKGFDRKMIEGFQEVGDGVTMVPVMRNLWVFDWKCMKCGKRWYQGPTPTECQEKVFKLTGKPCDGKRFKRKIMWVGKANPQSVSYCFDSVPHFQYFNQYKSRQEYKSMLPAGFTESMSLQGSCFMATREKFWGLKLSDETLGNWGNQGIEVAVKTWLSGGRVLVNHNTWYAHMFRTQGGDFSFPWENSGHDTQKTKDNVKEIIWNNKLPNQIHPLSWLLEKFWPVPGWTEEDLKKLEEAESQLSTPKTNGIKQKETITPNNLNGVIYIKDLIEISRKNSNNNGLRENVL